MPPSGAGWVFGVEGKGEWRMTATPGEVRTTGGALRALAAGCVGNFVEWYDFAIYSYSVTIIATLFFPDGQQGGRYHRGLRALRGSVSRASGGRGVLG